MKKTNDQTIREVIKQFTSQKKFKHKYFRFLVRQFWDQQMNSIIKESTESIDLKGNTLVLRLLSAPLKQELFYHKQTLIKKVNKYLGEDYVVDIKIH